MIGLDQSEPSLEAHDHAEEVDYREQNWGSNNKEKGTGGPSFHTLNWI